MPTALPLPAETNLTPPDGAESAFLARGFASAMRPASGLTELQQLLIDAVTEAMAGFVVDASTVEPITAEDFAGGLAQRNEPYGASLLDG
jgi:hypothetical protein